MDLKELVQWLKQNEDVVIQKAIEGEWHCRHIIAYIQLLEARKDKAESILILITETIESFREQQAKALENLLK